MTKLPNQPAPPHSTNTKVIIVGLGIAGLTAAIECHRNGHSVIGFEKKPDHHQLGDIIGLSANGLNVLRHWGEGSITAALTELGSTLSSIGIHNEAGELVDVVPFGAGDFARGLFLRRSALVEALFGYALELGIDLRFGVKVTEFWETGSEAGVVVSAAEDESEGEGEKVTGDCVIGTDGLRSRLREIITGDTSAPVGTGGAIFRSHFDAAELEGVVDAQWVLEGTEVEDRHQIYLGKDATILMGTIGKGRYVFWNCPHRDTAGVCDDWIQSADVNPVLEIIKSWPAGKKLAAVISKTPEGKCFSHSLTSRKPLKTWVSKKGRMIVIGDAAHPFLPHTGQGANQSIEDAAVLAICIKLAGREDVPLGLRVAEKLRYKRVSLIQEGSLEAQEVTLEADLDKAKDEDRFGSISRPDWIHGHDCIENAHEQFGVAAEAIAKGEEYVPTNAPSDGRFRAEDDYRSKK